VSRSLPLRDACIEPAGGSPVLVKQSYRVVVIGMRDLLPVHPSVEAALECLDNERPRLTPREPIGSSSRHVLTSEGFL
jgi:hypothetical protein